MGSHESDDRDIICGRSSSVMMGRWSALPELLTLRCRCAMKPRRRRRWMTLKPPLISTIFVLICQLPTARPDRHHAAKPYTDLLVNYNTQMYTNAFEGGGVRLQHAAQQCHADLPSEKDKKRNPVPSTRMKVGIKGENKNGVQRKTQKAMLVYYSPLLLYRGERLCSRAKPMVKCYPLCVRGTAIESLIPGANLDHWKQVSLWC